MFVSESSATTEILVKLPQHLLTELDGFVKQENVNRSEFIYQATKMYLRERKKRQIREVHETWIHGNGQDKSKNCIGSISSRI